VPQLIPFRGFSRAGPPRWPHCEIPRAGAHLVDHNEKRPHVPNVGRQGGNSAGYGSSGGSRRPAILDNTSIRSWASIWAAVNCFRVGDSDRVQPRVVRQSGQPWAVTVKPLRGIFVDGRLSGIANRQCALFRGSDSRTTVKGIIPIGRSRMLQSSKLFAC